MVVPVFITSCQVLEKPKKGPVTNQIRIIENANIKALVVPVKTVAECDNLSKMDGLSILTSFRI